MSKRRKKSADPIRDIPRYLRIFRSFIGARMYLVLALATFAALAEGIGIVMLLPLLQSLDGFAGEEVSGVGAKLADVLDWLGLGGSALAILLFIAMFFLLKGVFLFLSQGYAVYLSGRLMRELKGRLYDEYSRMRLQHYVSRDTGHFVNVINGQIMGFIATFKAMIHLGKDLVMLTVYFGSAMVVAWQFGVMAVVLGLVLVTAFRWLNIYIRDLSRKNAAESGILAKLLIQSLHSFKYLAATAQAAPLRKEAMASIKRLSRQMIRMGLAQAFTSAVQEPLAVIAILAIVIVQLFWLDQPLAPILVSILLFYRGLNGVMSLQKHWQGALSKMGSVEMVNDEFAIQALQREPDGTREIGPLTESIEFRHVHFAYERQEDVLSGISLVIPARTSVALVGESGSGKSTLVDLLTLMLRPRAGEILIDGVPGETIRLSSWRQQIGFVSQETVVFDDTIANNISLWRGNIAKDPFLFERVREAARQAHVAHVIESLPHGYNTLVGDRGVRLSGGQRQRLFLARELFKRPNLLILDEATSALDSESEQAIQRSIDALKGKMTVVMIAHRLATIRNVDRVFVIDKGRVVEEGSYDDLRDDRETRFAQLVAMQKL
ncbi:ABC transporter ATP-binding protein [Roseovarius sp.]|uniref:ABC transporter ATP-binding protein n=1 Tax=Roseovarius sp. TaxID=1486281 RepID=UPI003568E02E